MPPDPPRRRHRLAALAAVALLVAACGEQSKVDPDATVSVRGTVLDTDGSPLDSRPVRLGSGVTLGEGGLGVLTVGLACLTGECTGETFDTSTGEDGSFGFVLAGRDTQSSFGEAESFLLATSARPPEGRPTGPTVSARFQIQTTEVTLPRLRLVDVRPEIAAADDGRVTTSWTPGGAPAPYTVSYVDPTGYPLWESTATEPAATIDGRILEDVTGLATVSTSLTDRIEGSDLHIYQRSSGVAFRGGLGPPPSRGARCQVHGQQGSVEPLERCGLTDATLAPAGLPVAACPTPSGDAVTACEPIARVRVLLDAPVAAELVVVRGCVDPCRIAVVGDGGAVTDIGAVTAPFGLSVLDGRGIDAVDVVTDDVSRLAEVSVWPAVTVDRPLLAVDDPADLVPGEVTDAASDRRLPVVLAAAMLLLVVLLLGIAIGRRSRSAAI